MNNKLLRKPINENISDAPWVRNAEIYGDPRWSSVEDSEYTPKTETREKWKAIIKREDGTTYEDEDIFKAGTPEEEIEQSFWENSAEGDEIESIEFIEEVDWEIDENFKWVKNLMDNRTPTFITKSEETLKHFEEDVEEDISKTIFEGLDEDDNYPLRYIALINFKANGEIDEFVSDSFETKEEAQNFINDYELEDAIYAEIFDQNINKTIWKWLPGESSKNNLFEDTDEDEEEIGIYSKYADLDDEARYEYIKSKSVLDSDGFYTDYTMYKDNSTGNFVFVFGDNDVYIPEDEDFDYVAETEKEANEWFDNYNGFDEDMDEAFNEFATLDKKKEALEVDSEDEFEEVDEGWDWVASGTADFNAGYADGRNDKEKNQIKTEEDIRIKLKDKPMDLNEIDRYIAGYKKGIREGYENTKLNESTMSDIYSEIKSAYPEVEIKKYSKYEPISDVVGGTLDQNIYIKKSSIPNMDRFKKFLNYLFNKYFKGTDRAKIWYNEDKWDSDKDYIIIGWGSGGISRDTAEKRIKNQDIDWFGEDNIQESIDYDYNFDDINDEDAAFWSREREEAEQRDRDRQKYLQFIKDEEDRVNESLHTYESGRYNWAEDAYGEVFQVEEISSGHTLELGQEVIINGMVSYISGFKEKTKTVYLGDKGASPRDSRDYDIGNIFRKVYGEDESLNEDEDTDEKEPDPFYIDPEEEESMFEQDRLNKLTAYGDRFDFGPMFNYNESIDENTQISWISAEDLPIGKKLHYEGKEYEIVDVQDVDEMNPDQVFIILKDKDGKERKITTARNRAFTSVHDDWDYGEWESFENILDAASDYIKSHFDDDYMELNFIYKELGEDYWDKLSNEEKKQLSKLLRRPITESKKDEAYEDDYQESPREIEILKSYGFTDDGDHFWYHPSGLYVDTASGDIGHSDKSFLRTYSEEDNSKDSLSSILKYYFEVVEPKKEAKNKRILNKIIKDVYGESANEALAEDPTDSWEEGREGWDEESIFVKMKKKYNKKDLKEAFPDDYIYFTITLKDNEDGSTYTETDKIKEYQFYGNGLDKDKEALKEWFKDYYEPDEIVNIEQSGWSSNESLNEAAFSDLDMEIRDSEGIDKLIYKTERNVKALENEENFLINQAPREIKKGGAFDSQEEIDEALEETRKELSRERAKLRMLKGVK